MTRSATLSIPVAVLLVLSRSPPVAQKHPRESAAEDSSPPRPSPRPRTSSRTRGPGAGVSEGRSTQGEVINTQPVVPKGTGSAPTALKAETLIAGNGAEIKTGQQATVNYVGVLFKDGKEFDTSWGKGKQPFQFALGSGQVIPGWDQGVLGMKVGERRRLTIPADLAYGAQGSPPKIGPNEPLIFDIDLKKIG